MKKIKPGFIVIMVLLITACNNNKEKSSTDKKETTEVNSADTKKDGSDNIISFKANGEVVTSSGWNIGVFDPGNGAGPSINVTSNMHEQPKAVNFNINGNKPGIYIMEAGFAAVKTPGKAYGNYHPDYKNDMTNAFSFESGEFVIISIDDASGLFNATFHGIAKNGKDETVTITDGRVINAKLKR